MGRHHPTTPRWDPVRNVRRLLRRPPPDRWGRRELGEDAVDAIGDQLGSLWAAQTDESTRRRDSR